MASFQNRIVELIERKVKLALSRKKYTAFVVSGGVSANSAVRKMAENIAAKYGLALYMPELKYCQDNGAMVAAATMPDFFSGRFSALDFDVSPTVRPKIRP